jgi:hypothetical protein
LLIKKAPLDKNIPKGAYEVSEKLDFEKALVHPLFVSN